MPCNLARNYSECMITLVSVPTWAMERGELLRLL